MKKKNPIKIMSVLIIIMSLPYVLYAQESTRSNESSTVLPKEQTIYSPQVMEMMRYDRTSLQMSKGKVDLTIPLLEWKDKDFDLPISLFYNSGGFRPRETDNYVGRNWLMNIGGVVYRHVNGVPDDINYALEPLNAQVGVDSHTDGFLNNLNKKRFNLKKMEQDFKDNPYQYTYRRDMQTSESTLYGMGNIESSADVFYFSFGKHSGKFMINYDGSVSAAGNNGGKYEVDLSDMAIFSSMYPRETHIHIKTDDGYVYTFGGGGYSSLEYNIGWEGPLNQVHGNLKSQNEITAYHLTEIKAPNGRKMTFTYRDIDATYHSEPSKLISLSNGNNVDKNVAIQYTLAGRAVLRDYNLAPTYYLNNDAMKPNKELYTLTKSALLDHITVDETIIYFHYSPRDKHVVYNNNENEAKFPYNCGAKLDKIEMHTPGTIKTASFTYNYQAGDRMFLENVRTSGQGLYSFHYKGLGNLTAPTPFTYNIDYWGFWRGRKENNGIIPAMSADKNFPQVYTITSDDRDPTGEDYDYTLLKQVSYPTGGKTVFEYEANHCSRIPYIDVKYNSFPSITYERDVLAGGARVYSVTHYVKNDKAVKKSIFTYGEDMNMGDILYMPHYKYIGTLTANSTQYYIEYVSIDSEGITDLPHPATHISYPSVTEHFVHPSDKDLSNPHPYKITDFEGSSFFVANDFTFPTYTKQGTFEALWPERYFPTITLQDYNKRLLEHPTLDASLQYGKILYERYFNSDKELVQESTYKYEYINRNNYALRTYAPCPFFRLRTSLYTHLVKEPLFYFVLKQKTTITYPTPGKSFPQKQDMEFYSYDKYGYLNERIIPKINGDSLITYYYRYSRTTSSGFQMLPEVESVYLGNEKGERKHLWSNALSYHEIPSETNESWFVPSKHILQNSNYDFVSGTQYLRYDNYGNPLETLKHTGKKTTYIWGFKGQYLLARIENASYEEVSKVLEKSLEVYSKSQENHPELDLLRKELPMSKVYTYTYTNGLGLTSETSPDGRSTFYEYDYIGRVVKVYRTGENGKQEISQIYNYHITNY